MQARHTRTCSPAPLPTLCTLRPAAAKEPKARGGSVGVPTRALINRCRPNARHTTKVPPKKGGTEATAVTPASLPAQHSTAVPAYHQACAGTQSVVSQQPHLNKGHALVGHDMPRPAERGAFSGPQKTHACTHVCMHACVLTTPLQRCTLPAMQATHGLAHARCRMTRCTCALDLTQPRTPLPSEDALCPQTRQALTHVTYVQTTPTGN